ncbi:putative quinol monooxygenase [Streptomyces ipomoeae]|uniref:putative quinol monooxygenase n=1 Tax=Streptomyces ipomoeae TaxID=103232 RepID=UPI0011461683|nr:putative quinol monooxygenase [Streptomyces ipomoeae]MDX2933429.1 putative quinol monooxygenase [Streptomyces ipomoeae]TQE20302.1 antibiotic biosynthesis monooxygenase [Streptomyces ipomoeae]
MIFIAVRFPVRPEYRDQWLERVAEFTTATRSEPGNLFFDWSVDADDPNTFVLLEAFTSPEAGAAHVQSDHFKTAMSWMPDVVARTPDIINVRAEGQGWSKMAELSPRE